MPFPALSAMLPVHSDLLHSWLRAWMNLSDTHKSIIQAAFTSSPLCVSCHNPPASLVVVDAASDSGHGLVLFYRAHTVPHPPAAAPGEHSSALCLCPVPNHYHHPNHLSWCQVPAFRQGIHISRGNQNRSRNLNPSVCKYPYK